MAVTNEALDKIKGMLLREAVKALEPIRVSDVGGGDATSVMSRDAHLINGAVAFLVELHEDRSVLEFFELRRILEPAGSKRQKPARDRQWNARASRAVPVPGDRPGSCVLRHVQPLPGRHMRGRISTQSA